MSPSPRTVTELQINLFQRGVRWITRQDPMVTVCLGLLLLTMGGIAWGARAMVVTYIPQHLTQIQAGYEKIQATSAAQQKELTDRYLEDKRALREIHSKELNGLAVEFRGIADQMREVAKGQETLIRDFLLREQRREASSTKPPSATPGGCQ